MSDFRNRILAKCLKIYDREKSLWPIRRFLDRIDSEGTLRSEIWDDILPEIRKRYFPKLTVDSFLDEAISVYRASSSPSSALTDIWSKLDWEIPFNSDEFYEFVDRLEELLKNAPNPPKAEDWEYLNESLAK